VRTPSARKRDFIARKPRQGREFLPAQAGTFQRANGKEKAGTCFDRNDGVGTERRRRGRKTMTRLQRLRSVWPLGARVGATVCVWISRHKASF
jgi:hypothetical protein